uniref:Uncharacterized protein n=1 Tax=Tanacetum cinerariifolium TaxID=118510 RepID=A0A6L2KAN0_TANCI|nr:hypothetical protein [Tanacetum cinerariifolium]
MANLIQDNKHLEERLDSYGSRLYKLENLDIPQQLAEVRRKKKRRHDSPKTPHGSPPPPPPPVGLSGTSGSSRDSKLSQVPPPPPLPPSTNQEGQSHVSTAPSSSKTAALAEYTAWTTFDTRFKPSLSSIPEDLHMDDDEAPDEQVHSFDNEDIMNDYIPKVNLMQDWWKPLSDDRPATPEPAWSIPSSDLPTDDMATFIYWYCKQQGITELKQKDLEGPAYEIVKVFHPNVIHLQYQMEECHKLLTDKVDDALIRYNVSKPLPPGGQPAYYPDVGLEQMVPDQIWIKEECKYDIAAMYERDFKYLYPSDFEDLQRVEDFQLGIESYQTQLNLTKPQWDATGFEYKHDFTIIEYPRAVTFRDKYEDQGIQGQQDESEFEHKVAVCSSLRSLKLKCTIESRGEHRSKTGPDRPRPDRTETELVQNSRPRTGPKCEDGNPARDNIKHALGR